jgi:hypothetical protein
MRKQSPRRRKKLSAAAAVFLPLHSPHLTRPEFPEYPLRQNRFHRYFRAVPLNTGRNIGRSYKLDKTVSHGKSVPF